MNARLVQFSLGSGKRLAAEAVAERVIPAIRMQAGCERADFFAADAVGDYDFVVQWASKRAADAAASRIGIVLNSALAVTKGSASIRLFEVYDLPQ